MSVPLFISPSFPVTGPTGAVTFSAIGGSGTGYTWAVQTANSGSPTIDPASGAYVAGAMPGYSDTIRVTDSDGNTADRDVRVINGVSLLTLRTQARQRADMVNSQFVTDAEFNGYVNTAYQDLFDMLVTKYGDNYEVQAPFTFFLDGTADLYPLPPDFFKLLGVDLKIVDHPNGYVSLRPFNFQERNRVSIPSIQTFYGVAANLRYKLVGNQIMFVPRAFGGQEIRLWYVPKATTLTQDTDLVDGVNGWEEYIVLDAAIKALAKEETDTSDFRMQKTEIAKRISDNAANRDAARPMTVTDTAYDDTRWGGGRGYDWSY